MTEQTEFREVACGSWDELLRQFEGFHGWYFRGHSSAQWSIQSTLERRTPSGESGFLTEFTNTNEFRRRAHNYVTGSQLPTTPGGWLALMQHFGAPTRLVDFTHSPYVAAYFAFEDLPTDGSDRCAVIAINRGTIHEKLGAIALSSDGGLFGLPATVIRKSMATIRNDLGPKYPHLRDEFVVGDLLAGMVDGHIPGKDERPLVALFEPDKLTERMSIQQGMFLWPANADQSVAANIRALGDVREGLVKLTVPITERPRALEQLRFMNITRASLFPGLDGFAHSFRQLPVRESYQARALRHAILGLSGRSEEG